MKYARSEELLPMEDQVLLSTASAVSDTPEGDETGSEKSKLADVELINLDDVDQKEL